MPSSSAAPGQGRPTFRSQPEPQVRPWTNQAGGQRLGDEEAAAVAGGEDRRLFEEGFRRSAKQT